MTVQSAQLVLPISIDPDATWAHWVSRVETEHLESAVQQVAGERDQGVFVWGGAGEGKSHLLQASCAGQSESVRYIPMDAVLEYPPAAVLEAAEHESLVVIDDIHLLSEHRIWQEGVFHCFNRCMQNSTPFLVSARTAPSGLTSFLPDLQSRLSLLSVFKLPAGVTRILRRCSCVLRMPVDCHLRLKWLGFWGCVFDEHLRMLNELFARSTSLVWLSSARPRSRF
jgi:DnaA family protein